MDNEQKNSMINIDVKDLPLNKLIDTVSKAIGIIYEPRNVKQLAKAEAEKIREISGAVRENDDLDIVYNDGALSISALNENVLLERAKTRLAVETLKKQHHIDSVVSNAIDYIENAEQVSETPVDIDWLDDFFEKVSHISNEQMQKLWARILVGEVCEPGTYSKRTLDVLAKLTTEEAILYSKIVPYVLNCMAPDNEFESRDYFIPTDRTVLNQCGISYDTIFRLDNAGLMDSSGWVSVGIVILPNSVEYIFHGDKAQIAIENKTTTKCNKSCSAYLLTQEGMELLKVSKVDSLPEGIEDYFVHCKKLFK